MDTSCLFPTRSSCHFKVNSKTFTGVQTNHTNTQKVRSTARPKMFFFGKSSPNQVWQTSLKKHSNTQHTVGWLGWWYADLLEIWSRCAAQDLFFCISTPSTNLAGPQKWSLVKLRKSENPRNSEYPPNFSPFLFWCFGRTLQRHPLHPSNKNGIQSFRYPSSASRAFLEVDQVWDPIFSPWR